MYGTEHTMGYQLDNFVFGHTWATDLLARAIAAGKLSQSVLITGMPQLGKTTLARTVAMAINCTAPEKPCGHCAACTKILDGNHPDVRILDDDDALKIEEVRTLQHDLSLTPHESLQKIAILANFDRATTGAANALLKTLEEPPAHAMLLLTARSTEHLLPTIVSRCQNIHLRPVSTDAIAEMLQQQWHVPAATATHLSHLSTGRPGWAVQAFRNPEVLEQRTAWLTDMTTALTGGAVARLAFAEQLAKQSFSPSAILDLWLSWWRDVLLAHNQTAAHLVNVDMEDTIRRAAQNLSQAQIVAAIAELKTTLQNFDYNVNRRLNFETLLLKLPPLKP